MRSRSARAGLPALVVACAWACGPREDVTPAIAVQPGAAARAMALLGHGGPNDPALAREGSPDAGTVAVEKPGTLLFSCLEARGAFKALSRVPCEVSLVPARKAAAVDAVDLVSETGKVAIPLLPGGYQVTASRGLEYARVSWEAEIVAGKATWGPSEGATVLRRVVDTRGYLATDLRGGAPAGDAGDGDDPSDVVIQDAAEGIEAVLGDAAGLVARAVQEVKLDDALAVVDSRARDADALDAWGDRSAFLARLVAKRPATPVAVPPARTYVRVDDDSSPATWSPAREADLVRGLRERRDVVLTNGPFLRVTANGAPIGGVAGAAGDRDVEVRVHVECAPWVAVDRVSIVRASGASVPPQSLSLRATADARAADVSFHLHAATDDAFLVVADSSAPAEAARAVSGAIWIDADGDGESLGRR